MTKDISIIRAADAATYDLPGVRFRAGAAPSRGSAQLCAWTITVAPGHESDQGHTLDRDEVFTVLAGSIRLQLDGEALHPGDTAVVPAGTTIRLGNPGPEPARALVAVSAGFVATAEDGAPLGTPAWAR